MASRGRSTGHFSGGIVASVAWLVVTAAIAHGSCIFHCESSLCGLVNITISNVTFNNLDRPNGRYQAPTAATVDLRGGGITSIAPGGLGCFAVSAFLLDNNPLTAFPNATLFQADLGDFFLLSVTNCSISALDAAETDAYYARMKG